MSLHDWIGALGDVLPKAIPLFMLLFIAIAVDARQVRRRERERTIRKFAGNRQPAARPHPLSPAAVRELERTFLIQDDQFSAPHVMDDRKVKAVRAAAGEARLRHPINQP